MRTDKIAAKVLFQGDTDGVLLRLNEPLSFWGGVDPQSGRITQVRHPQCGESVAGHILALPGTIGSSSSSAVMLELIRTGNAPAGLILIEPDAILLLGCLVAAEMGWRAPPAIQITLDVMLELSSGRYRIRAEELIRLA